VTRQFPVGKVPAEWIEGLWRRHALDDPSVIIGPGVGLDVAVVDLGDVYLVAKTDPITFATDRIGWYAVHVCANDVACSGARPEWFLATLLLPEGQAGEAQVETIFDGIQQACSSIGASWVGGHTEVTRGIDRPIVIGSLFGRVAKDALVTSAGARAGDHLYLAGMIPIEATAILAHDFAERLADDFEPAFLERCRRLLFDPGISVLAPARLALQSGGVHAMHDPTEGGLATGLWELAQASAVDLEVEAEAIPLLPEGRALCQHFGLDPLATIASGALLISLDPAAAPGLEELFERSQRHLQSIGRVVAGEGRVYLTEAGSRRRLEPPPRDEIARLFA
jgi:hydrogenase maturation factor